MLNPAWNYLFCTWVPDEIISLTLISLSNRKCRKVEVMRWRRILTSDTNSQENDRLWKSVPTLAPRPGRGQEPWLWWKGNYARWGKGRNVLFALEAPFKRERGKGRGRGREPARWRASGGRKPTAVGRATLSEWGRLMFALKSFAFPLYFPQESLTKFSYTHKGLLSVISFLLFL